MTVAEDGALRFVSGAVLFPQRWSLAEKLGMDMRWASCTSVILLSTRALEVFNGLCLTDL